MKESKKKSNLFKKLIKNYPNIVSGRKNFDNHHKRIEDTLKLIKKYKKNLISKFFIHLSNLNLIPLIFL